MRLIAIGDIHGCFRALSALVDAVPILPEDRVVTLGDHIDRGPDSRAVLDWLVQRAATGALVALRGNHEVMAIDGRDDPDPFAFWTLCGGAETLRSYGAGGESGRIEDVPEEHWRFMAEDCIDILESETHFFVHADVEPSLPLDGQPEAVTLWRKVRNPAPHCSGKIMVCGHTPQHDGDPLVFPHAVCIDTWAYGGGWLTALDPASGDYWQASEAGATRRGNIADLHR